MRVTMEIEGWLRARSEGLAERALLEAQQDTRRTVASARQQRDAAQRARVQQLRRAADHLTDAARAGVAGAVLRGGCGLVASAALWGKVGLGVGAPDWLEATVRSADGVARVDPFGVLARLRESEGGVARLRATQAEQAAERAGDRLREAERLSAGYLQRLQALAGARHAAAMAMLGR